jgi:FKBP-type peptidyl-prolyl cis-trans isomerase (trigger factor)
MKTNTKITNNSDNSFTISFTVSIDDIKKEYDHTLSHVAANFESKGFRKGKAPLDVVKSQVSEDKMLDEVINHLLSEKYDEVIKENKIKPATDPAVKILNPPFTLDKEWQIEISSANIPPISIKATAYTEIKKINADPKLEKEKKTDAIMKVVLENCETKIAKIILQNEVERKLTNLVDQIQKASLTFEAYLKNKGQTLDQLKQELEHQSQDEWTLNLAINQISNEQKLNPTPEEVKDIISKNPSLSQNPSLVIYLLTQQKVINYLLGL